MSTDTIYTDCDELLVHIDNHIAHVILNRPNSRNALTFSMYENLAKICSRAGSSVACLKISSSLRPTVSLQKFSRAVTFGGAISEGVKMPC